MSKAGRLHNLLVVVSFTALVVHAQVAAAAPPEERGAGAASLIDQAEAVAAESKAANSKQSGSLTELIGVQAGLRGNKPTPSSGTSLSSDATSYSQIGQTGDSYTAGIGSSKQESKTARPSPLTAEAGTSKAPGASRGAMGGTVQFFLDEGSFQAALDAAGKIFKVDETFEEAVGGGILVTCDPLDPGCNDGIFSPGDIPDNLAFQSNILDPGTTPGIGLGMIILFTDSLGPGVPPNNVVGANTFLESTDIFSVGPDNHTAMGLIVADLAGGNLIAVRVFDKNENLLGTGVVDGADTNGNFIGVLVTGDTIGRINLSAQNGGGELLYEMAAYLGGPFCGDGVVNQPGEQCDTPDDAACPGQCIPPGLPNECTCPPMGDCVVFTNKAAFEAFNADDGKFLKGIEDFEETPAGTPPQSIPDPLCGGIPNGPFANGLDELNLCVQSNNLGGAADVPSPTGANGLAYIDITSGFGTSSDVVVTNFAASSFDLMFGDPVPPDQQDNHTGVGFDAVSIQSAGAAVIRVFDKNNVEMASATTPADETGSNFWGVWCPDTIGRINVFDPGGFQGADNIQLWSEEVGIPNDDCADRIPIFDGLTNYDTTGATTDGALHAPPLCMFDGQTYHDIWYNYVSTCTGVLNITMCAPGDAFYDTDLVVYDRCDVCPPGDGDVLGCNDDDCTSPSNQAFVSRLPDSGGQWAMNVVAGNCYKIRVGGFQDGDQGPGTISIECKPEPSACTLFTNKAEFEAFNEADGKFFKGLERFEETIPPVGILGFADPLCGGVPNPPFDNGIDELNLCVQSNTLAGGADVPSPHGANGLVFVEFGSGFGNSSDIVMANYFAESLDIMFGDPVPPDQQDNHTGVGFDTLSLLGGGVVDIRVFDKNNVEMASATWPADEPGSNFFGVWCPDTIGRINIFDLGGGAQGADNIQMWLEPDAEIGACCDHAQPGGVCIDNVLPGECIGVQDWFFPGMLCADVEAQGLCEEHIGACCDQSQPGGSCTDNVPESQCLPGGGGGGVIWTSSEAEFSDLVMQAGKKFKGIETFEESNIPDGFKQPLPDPLQGGIPNVDPDSGIGFPNGLSELNLGIQANLNPGPSAPAAPPTGNPLAMYVVGNGFLGANSKKVGEDFEILLGIPASIDLIFKEPNHTAVGFELSRFEGFGTQQGWIISAFDKNENLLGKFTVPGPVPVEPGKTFVGVVSTQTIGRINIFDLEPDPQPESLDNIQMWLGVGPPDGGDGQIKWFKDLTCDEIECFEHIGACCDQSQPGGSCTDNVPESQCLPGGGGGGDGGFGGCEGFHDVAAGLDLFMTPAGGGTVTHVFNQAMGGFPIPADFFGPGSDPFDGSIELQGLPLTGMTVTDTIVQRLQDADFPPLGDPNAACPSAATIDIEIVALSLVSSSPIVVTFNGGQNPDLWDVYVCLSDVPQLPGSMTIRHDCPDGGTFESLLPVLPKLIFTRAGTGPDTCVNQIPGNPANRCLDAGLIGFPPDLFEAFDVGWVHVPDPAFGVVTVDPGLQVDGNCDGAPEILGVGSSCFVPGIIPVPCDCGTPPGGSDQFKKLTIEQALLAAHGVLPAQVPGGGDQIKWFKDLTCDEIECFEHTGACCDGTTGDCEDGVPESQCPTGGGGGGAGPVGVVTVIKDDPDIDALCTQGNGDFVPGPLDVCNVYVHLDPPATKLLSVGFADITANGNFYQHPFGGDTSPACNLLPVFPDLVCDSFVTVGRKCSDANDGSATGCPFDSAAFNGVGQVSGAWFNGNPPNGQGLPDANGNVLVAQLAVSAGQSISGIFTAYVEGPFGLGGPCPDIDGDGFVGALDLAFVLGSCGPCPGGPCPADFNGDGVVDSFDIAFVLAHWGPCGIPIDFGAFDLIFECFGPDDPNNQFRWEKDTLCSDLDPPCTEHTGACCDGTTGDCQDNVPESQCACLGTACPCDCDVDGNGICDPGDLGFVLGCFGSPTSPGCQPADLNCDGNVDDADVNIIACFVDGGPPEECCPPSTPGNDQCRWEKDTLCSDLVPQCTEHTGACCDGTTGNCDDDVPESECPVGCFGECINGGYCDDPDCCINPDDCLCYSPNNQISIELCGDCFGECFKGGYCDPPEGSCCIDPDLCQCYGPNNPISISLCGDCFGECFMGGYCDPPEGNCCIEPGNCICYDPNHPVSIKLCGDLPDPDSQYRWEKDTMCSDLDPPCEEHTGACCDHSQPGGACADDVPESQCIPGNPLGASGPTNPMKNRAFRSAPGDARTVENGPLEDAKEALISPEAGEAGEGAGTSGPPACFGDATSLFYPLDGTYVLVDFFGDGPTGSGPAQGPGQHNDDDSATVPLGFTFDLYGDTYTTAFANNNGNLSFGTFYSSFTPAGFPNIDFVMVAPFWGDVDTGNPANFVGDVYQKQFDSDGDTFDDTLVVTWDNVGYYNEHGDLRNTFQVAISDGTNPVMGIGNNVCFSWDNMCWTTGDASGGVGGFGGSPAIVGANRGNGVDYFQIGAFDHAGVDWDGQYGNNDGVSFLDGQTTCFNVAVLQPNVPPIPVGFPQNNKVTVNAFEGEVLNLDLAFLSPEILQNVSVTVADLDGAQAAGLAITIVNGLEVATVALDWDPDCPADEGSYALVFTATDDGSPPGETVITLQINIVCEDSQIEWFKDLTCDEIQCLEHTGACCDHAQPGGQCTSDVPQSECLGPPEIFVTEDPAEFEAFMLQSGKLLKGIETFEEGIIPAGFFADLVDPLAPGVPNIDPLGFGFPIGLLEDNLLIQSNVLGENAPVPAPGAGLRGVGPGAIGPGVPNSIVVGTRYPGQGGDGVMSDSLDIIFTEPNHTGVGFDVIDPTAPPRIIHITVFNKNNQVIFKGDVPGTPDKVFFGIWSSQTIGRINLAGESSPGVNDGAEYIDNIQMWLGGESQREWFKDEDCVEDGGTIDCDEHTGACCDGTSGDCEDDVPESECPVGATPDGIGTCGNEQACATPCPARGACTTDADCGPGGVCQPACVPSSCNCENNTWTCTADCNGLCAAIPDDQHRWEKGTLCSDLVPQCTEHTGACCDGTTGECEDGVPESECPVDPSDPNNQYRWEKDTLCSDLDPQCTEHTGACCDGENGSCEDNVPESQCPPGQSWEKDTLCVDFDPPCGGPILCNPECPTDIPEFDGSGFSQDIDAWELANLLGCWSIPGPPGPCPPLVGVCTCFDFDGDGCISAIDLAGSVLGEWGACCDNRCVEGESCVNCSPNECITETWCNDGVDNDCDGLIDCADPDCIGDADCP